MHTNSESARLEETRMAKSPWRKWGPYLSERQWGTVREDYSEDGNAWDYFTHDRPDPAHTTGARMVLPVSAITSSYYVLRLRCGTAKTPSSKNGCSV
jgi:hypothetical protein